MASMTRVRSLAGCLFVILVACGGSTGEAPTTLSTAAEAPSTTVAEASSTTAAPSSTTAASTPSSTLQAPTTTEESLPSAAGWPDSLVLEALGAVEGAPLGYLEYLPPGYGDGTPRPLLVFLHGGGEAGDGSEAALPSVAKRGIPQLIASEQWPDDQPFVVLSPQYGPEPAAGPCDVADEVADFLEFAIDHYDVDADQVYLTGISCGAIGIWDYLAVHGDGVIAAAVPISGHAEWALEAADCESLGDVPVWAFHGAMDEIVPTVHIEGPMDQIRACNETGDIEMELTVYPDADHDAWSRTYDGSAGHDIYSWMLSHSRS